MPNEPEALVINYYLKADARGGGEDHGHGFRRQGRARDAGPGEARPQPRAGDSGRRLGGRGGGRGRGAAPAGEGPLTVGDYTVTVDVAGQTLTKPAKVRARIGM